MASGWRCAVAPPVEVWYTTCTETTLRLRSGQALGSTSLTTYDSGPQAGEVVARQLYHPYGEVRWQDGTLPTDFGFTGQRGVPGVGLVFMHARYYHPALGRWTQADTLVPDFGDPQSLNRYSWVRNQPLSRIDPTGHDDGPTDEEIEQIVNGIFEEAGDNPAQALIMMFENDELPGDTVEEQLDWILGYTRKIPGLYTGDKRFTGVGLKEELRDDDLYSMWYGEDGSPSIQVGHFLTAVAFGQFAGDDNLSLQWTIAEAFVVGHELSSDGPLGFLGVPVQIFLGLVWIDPVVQFRLAAAKYENKAYRDMRLSACGGPGLGSEGRRGNSMADLRLSALGWNLGQAIVRGDINDRNDVADWLRTNIAKEQ
ncbi:MAG: RHS repeat-associated core domain-containing protein [Chloroflexota bacterium]|nr:RHS repeat-associated core domain-containing protein [Chloroflexota bacterium]